MDDSYGSTVAKVAVKGGPADIEVLGDALGGVSVGFIRLTVAMCSASSTFRGGRPNLVPLVRDAARFSAVRSLISSRSYSAREPRTPVSQS